MGREARARKQELMLTREFRFTNDQRGRVDFRICYEAFRGRDPAKIPKEDRRYLAEIQRALEAISEPIGDLAEDAELDLRLRKLSTQGHVMLSQRAFDRLVSAIEEAPFHAGLSAQVEDVLERLSAAEKIESEQETASASRPVPVPRSKRA